MNTTWHIGRATRHDRDALHAMQLASMRELGAAGYAPEAIEAFIAEIGTMDDTLIDDGTYFVALADGVIVGGGGWSTRMPAFAAQAAAVGAAAPSRMAFIRSLYVRPTWARRGIGRQIMTTVETDMAAAGYESANLTATLVGIPFYRRLGYRAGKPVVLGLRGGLQFIGLAMNKSLGTIRFDSAA